MCVCIYKDLYCSEIIQSIFSKPAQWFYSRILTYNVYIEIFAALTSFSNKNWTNLKACDMHADLFSIFKQKLTKALLPKQLMWIGQESQVM